MIDVPGLNYRAHRYVESYETLPQNIVLGSETASTVSSRGVYKFPVQKGASVMYDDHQCSGYDVESHRFVVEKGAFEILAGPSSADLPLQATVVL